MADDDVRERDRRDVRAVDAEAEDDRFVDDRYDEDRHSPGGEYLDEGGYNEQHDREDPGNPLWDETLVVLLLVAGVALLLFPEPATSGLGVLLIAVGILAWLVDAIG